MANQQQNQDQQGQDQQMIGMDATPEQQEKLVHLGKMMGDPRDNFDREVEKHLANLYAREASAAKMEAAKSGGAGPGLGPTEAEAALMKQRAFLEQQTATQGQTQAAQAQAAQPSLTPPPAPSGPVGVTEPYPAQRGEDEAGNK